MSIFTTSLVSDPNIVFGANKFRESLRGIKAVFKERGNAYSMGRLDDYVDEVKLLYLSASTPNSENRTNIDFLYDLTGRKLNELSSTGQTRTLTIDNIDLIQGSDLDYAFENCDALQEVSISAKYIVGGLNGTFRNCKNIKKATICADEISFDNPGSLQLQGPAGQIDVPFARSLSCIFAGCDSLEEIAFPNHTLRQSYSDPLLSLLIHSPEYLFGESKDSLKVSFANGSLPLEKIRQINP